MKAELPTRKSAFERLGRDLTVPQKESDMLMPKAKIRKTAIMPPAKTSPVNKASLKIVIFCLFRNTLETKGES